MTAHGLAHPFSETQWQRIHALLEDLDPRQALWLSGYLAGQRIDPGDAAPADPAPTTGPAVLIAYGTETDNSRHLAERLKALCDQAGIASDLQNLERVRVRQLARRAYLVVITATHGDGEPPEPALSFFEELADDTAPKLDGVRFAVLALGDSTYEHFCTAGRTLDARLEALGGQRLIERQECDVDFETPARQWLTRVLASLPRPKGATVSKAPATPVPARPAYDKQTPLETEVLVNQCLSASDRASPIHHLELALDVADFPAAPGDAVGILADNPPELVAAVLDASGLSAEQPVTVDGQARPLVEALRQHRDLTLPGSRFLEYWAGLSGDAGLRRVLENGARDQRAFLRRHQVLDILHHYPARPEAAALVDALRPLQPRLYDLANSLDVESDALHLTAKLFRYPFEGRLETGIASRYLLNLQPGDPVRLYPHRNARFQLPSDPRAPLILIAEGTGIAPYRAFVQHLAASGRPAPCWLVFAEQRFEEDFLYQLTFQDAHARGVLERVDTVFHADQPDRDLADPLLARAGQLFDWLNRDAHLYFCGDKDRLGDTEARLREAVDAHLGAGHWKQLSKARRLHRNLY
ncbi:MAG: sulfite reductase flavoprotein subunit alpha [Alcanivorax sp.]|uniref:diflavin oxidoreductase n=1 Tax=Alloalcanivorax marinus TaxID=1177169 RepID=UPI0019560DD3|nr:sulfite reductase flavoprotein subunit alpha [Alloalcanivorax marinus]MBM7333415.1 flavodoxin domain-containing protein [Alloalcanivorax marinus]